MNANARALIEEGMASGAAIPAADVFAELNARYARLAGAIPSRDRIACAHATPERTADSSVAG